MTSILILPFSIKITYVNHCCARFIYIIIHHNINVWGDILIPRYTYNRNTTFVNRFFLLREGKFKEDWIGYFQALVVHLSRRLMPWMRFKYYLLTVSAKYRSDTGDPI